jgi:polysaccharide export outer membrane protein
MIHENPEMKLKHLIVCLLAVIASSCVSNEKIIYLQNLEGEEPIPEDSLINYAFAEYRLQYNDIVDVQIQTSDEGMNALFNIQPKGGTGNMSQGITATGGDIYYMTGFSLDKEGFIELPLVGKVNLRNQTLSEAKESISQELTKYFINDDYFIRVKLGGIRYSALGEFRRPGKFVVLQDRMTIFEAIANAGDLNVAAKRDEVLLIRQYPEGTKLHRINLNDRHLIHSPYYFIQPNDQLYVEPMKIRELGSGENFSQSLSLIVTSISAAALVLNLILK